MAHVSSDTCRALPRYDTGSCCVCHVHVNARFPMIHRFSFSHSSFRCLYCNFNTFNRELTAVCLQAILWFKGVTDLRARSVALHHHPHCHCHLAHMKMVMSRWSSPVKSDDADDVGNGKLRRWTITNCSSPSLSQWQVGFQWWWKCRWNRFEVYYEGENLSESFRIFADVFTRTARQFRTWSSGWPYRHTVWLAAWRELLRKLGEWHSVF